ncbi:hypothetical protein [Synoicihabitans lomoniglobus]|uniref:Uncharacterized protein n=1 Tax=Synoicihabitans lomoniglobus TaxID=2909285 RepID=A0AAF0CSM7_9BACT|nr:hypothetical protein [Opitutaceae bacterium LMO-M01]WED67359.1 hypothetical protein PXH66_10915 [Opitutaceae bacterium LMO-M01]
MAQTKTNLLDVDDLMARIRAEVSQQMHRSALQKRSSQALYSPGQVLNFKKGGNAESHLVDGWATAETNYRWTVSESATMAFRFEQTAADMVLTFTAHPHLGGETSRQTVTASWDNTPVGSWNVSQPGTYSTLILSEANGSDNIHNLRFSIPTCFSPESKGISADPRPLGLAFVELILHPADAFGFQK